ncbi:hypothetical protein [Clostridium sp. OM02-18AC]|uniref:hypothetical protein n=1 Tax=Clostridium sp. OM02-18AC TaxID=2292311 RepID=UPI0011C2382B|nr:hypothetical protein [Clostridium sp. OM02-18AC]
MTNRVNSITRNYNNEPLKPGEVLVPTMYDAAFAKAHCTNPDCIKIITIAGRNFKVLYMAVPESVAKAARSSFNLALNEQLGHYAVPSSVSIDQLADDYDFDLATVPSPEDMMIEQENKAETATLFANLVHHLIDRSPKHGLAALLLLNDVKGAEFHEKMHLGHDAANTVRKQSADLLKAGLANVDMDKLHIKQSKHNEYYRTETYRLLDALLKLYNA